MTKLRLLLALVVGAGLGLGLTFGVQAAGRRSQHHLLRLPVVPRCPVQGGDFGSDLYWGKAVDLLGLSGS